MRIHFRMEGGVAYFPGLSKPVTIESDQLPKEEAAELKRLVDAARFFDLPTMASAPRRGAADYYQYTVTIEEGRRSHSVRLADPLGNPDLQALLDFLRAKARALRKAGRARTSD